MITFDEFVNKWNNKGIDFDGVYGDQCMDLMHQYCVEVLGITDGRVLAAPAAKDVWLTNVFGKDKFDAITNTPTGVPQKGDIVLWGTGVGPYGHVAVFRDGDVNQFNSFDQNWPSGSVCHIQNHNYNGVLGWLRFKAPAVQNTTNSVPTITDQTKIPQIVDDNGNAMEVQAIRSTLTDLRTKVKSLQSEVNSLNGTLDQIKALVS